MKNLKPYLWGGACFFLILLLIPPLWYSLRTPFALIDDYSNWWYFRYFTHLSGIVDWYKDTWVNTDGRFRVTYDIYQVLTWAFFTTHSTLHHLMRWVLKAIVIFASFKILRLMAPPSQKTIRVSFWIFCVIYLFFPNNPEARLAPQELLTVVFLSLLLYELGKLLISLKGNLGALPFKRYLWVFFLFIAMLWSKEPNLLIGLVVLGVLIPLNLKRCQYWLPLVVIVVITAVRVWLETHGGGYGTAPVTCSLIFRNLYWNTTNLFLCRTSFVCSLLLIVPFLVGVWFLLVKTWGTRSNERNILRGIINWANSHPVLVFYWLIGLSFLAFYLALLTSWDQVLRYFYPLEYLLALSIALTFLSTGEFLNRHKLVISIMVILGSIYYIGANYYNFVYQFADQYYTRLVEKDVLDNVDQLLKSGKTVTITIDSEFERKIQIYFNEYLPFYKHSKYRITIGPPLPQQSPDSCFYVTRKMQPMPAALNWYHQFYPCHVSRILSWSDKISSWFNFGRHAFHQEDAGSTPIGRHGEEINIWYIYNCSDVWGYS